MDQPLREIPPPLRAVLRRDPRDMECSPMFSAAVAYARAGVLLLPVEESGKRPHTVGRFQNGALSATREFEAVRDHWFNHPYDNVGWASDGTVVLADIDPRKRGSLEAAAAIGLPVDGYRERTVGGGWHLPLLMPSDMKATCSCEPAPGVELKARGSYVVSPHSRIGTGWYGIEPDRNVWRFGAIPERWEHLDRLTGTRVQHSIPTVTAADRGEALRLERAMRRSSNFGPGIAALLGGDTSWQRYFPAANDLTESGRDFQLALAATHFLRNNDRRDSILAALLVHHSRKFRRHASPDAYIVAVVAGATAARDSVDADQRTSFATRFVMSALQSTIGCKPQPVFEAKNLTNRERPRVMEETILNFACSDEVDKFTRDDRWRRFPFQTVADIFDVDRETVRLRLVALEGRGQIERQAPTGKHDGTCRKDSLVRLVVRAP